jgi:pimeloyl-ACP methyl ester carboxylesterase
MFVDIGTARIFFDVVGAKLAIDGERMVERPTLIFMHGGPGFDHSTLRPYFDRFADTHQVIYIDHRGNGRSTGAPDTWRLDQWGDDVKAICDALGIESRWSTATPSAAWSRCRTRAAIPSTRPS